MKRYLIIDDKGLDQNIDKLVKENSDFARFLNCEIYGQKRDSELFSKQEPYYLKFAKKLGFAWEENADSGLIQYNYKANFIMSLVKEYSRVLVSRIGFPIYEVRGSNIFDLSHRVVEDYAQMFGDRLYSFKSGDKNVVLSYDASYPQFNIAAKSQLSYKDLPFAHFSVSDCYRHEQSGECMMLYRERRFFMPDLHPYFADVKQAFKWYGRIEKQLIAGGDSVNREYFLSIEVSSEDAWNRNKESIINLIKNSKRKALVIINDDLKERYWIINCDYKIIDMLGQSREICCIQMDIGNAKRLGIKYVKKDGSYAYPIIIHAAVPGGIERFIYMILDRFESSMPIWLRPIQVRLIPVNKSYLELSKQLLKKLERKDIRIDIDDRNLSVGKKVLNAREELIPYSIVIGEKEAKGKGNIDELSRIVKRIVRESKGMPYKAFLWPKFLSKRID